MKKTCLDCHIKFVLRQFKSSNTRNMTKGTQGRPYGALAFRIAGSVARQRISVRHTLRAEDTLPSHRAPTQYAPHMLGTAWVWTGRIQAAHGVNTAPEFPALSPPLVIMAGHAGTKTSPGLSPALDNDNNT